MPRYHYTAICQDGKKKHGVISAETAYAARKQLRFRNIHPTDIKEKAGQTKSRFSFDAIFSRTSKAQILEFTKQLATLLKAGIKLTEALSVLTMQTSDERFKHAISDIRERVVTGESFADALADYTQFFDVIYVSMIRVGEVTGSLDNSLQSVASFMEKRERVKSKLITAMIYPMVLLGLSIGVIIVITTFIIPKIATLIEKTGQELPWITKALMNVSYVMRNWWILIIAFVVLIVYLFKRFIATEKGALIRDKFLLWLPVFGPLIKQRVVARFSATLSVLLSSGLSMAESLRIVAEVTGNAVMNRAVKQARGRILSGADIATPLRDSGVIDPAIAHMVTVGEKSGELDSMLRAISENLESSTDVVIERLSAALEPLIIIVMAVVIGFIAYATLLPIIRFSAEQF